MVPLKKSFFASGIRWFAPLLFVLGLLAQGSAQTAIDPPQRWLLIFDTSITMERWLNGTTTELQNLFFNSMGGQLRQDDSIGVWTFADKLQTGQYPLFTWMPGRAAEEAARLNDFLEYRHYFSTTKFAVLKPALRQVIADSPRLNIVIFCDGKDKFKLTPYDDGINQAFDALLAECKKHKVPFVVVIRTQNGKFVGATVNLPPGSLDFPVFPPLPVVFPTNPVPEAVVGVPPPLAPVVPVAPLIIVGTNVLTNSEDIQKASGP
jgi:hypothetical protein